MEETIKPFDFKSFGSTFGLMEENKYMFGMCCLNDLTMCIIFVLVPKIKFFKIICDREGKF